MSFSEKAVSGGKVVYKCCGNCFGGFRDFILRGNVVELAVAVVIGTAFTSLVNAFVRDFITPLIGAIFQGGTFSDLYFSVNGSKFFYGDFINVLITFILICLIVYFAIVLPMNVLMARVYGPPKAQRDCPDCFSEVPALATKCAFCCSPLIPTALGDGTVGGELEVAKEKEQIRKAEQKKRVKKEGDVDEDGV